MKKILFSFALMLCGTLGLIACVGFSTYRCIDSAGNPLTFLYIYDLLIPAIIFAVMLISGIVFGTITIYKDKHTENL